MSKYIIKRILIAIPVLLGITIIDYAIMCLAGSPLEILQGPVSRRLPWKQSGSHWGWISPYMYSILCGWENCCVEIWGIP